MVLVAASLALLDMVAVVVVVVTVIGDRCYVERKYLMNTLKKIMS